MTEHIHFLKEIPLLPDAELLEQLREAQHQAGGSSSRAADRASRRQIDRRLEALRNELKNRGMSGPPWWCEG